MTANSNTPTLSLSSGDGWMVIDSFTLSFSAQVTGFTDDFNFATPNDATWRIFLAADCVSTNWWIWTSDPAGGWSAVPAFSGTTQGVNTQLSKARRYFKWVN